MPINSPSWSDRNEAKGVVKVPAILSIAKKAGIVTAMVVSKSKFRTLDLPGSLDIFLLPADPSSASLSAAFQGIVSKLKPNWYFHFRNGRCME